MTDVDALVAALTLEEKAALTAGEDLWSTVAVERLGIPKITVTDGPNGARGPGIPGMSMQQSTCIPCASAVGATWDAELAESLGALVGREALDRGCRVLLAPTVNLHRSPLAGRNFECYSEDPLLSGRLAAGFVRGVQGEGVVATVKHLVGNEAEFERNTISSVIDARALRELYLLPFELAVREGGALGLMTAYNRCNGRWVTEQAELLRDVVRGEWGFDGLVMTDWFAFVDTAVSIAAGLDLEMPGPGRAYGPALVAAVADGSVAESDVDAAVRRLLGTFDRVGALADATTSSPTAPGADVVALVRRAAADAMVLLHNDGTLPLDRSSLRSVAVIGPNADATCIMGGGSAEVTPWAVLTPLEALRTALGPDLDVRYARGCGIDRSPRPLGSPGLRAVDGFEVELFSAPGLEGEVVDRSRIETLRTFFFGPPHPDLAGDDWSMRVRGTVVASESGTFTLALAQGGRARVHVGGRVVLDGVEHPPPPGGTEFFGFASQELLAEVAFTVGEPVEVVVELSPQAGGAPGVRVGFHPPDVPDLLDRAVETAAAADVAVVVVGTTREWESEMRDRAGLVLPGRQEELIRRVAATGRPTVVVVNAGAPVDVSWCDDVAATLQCWFGGDQMAPALADVLTGVAEPGGRLPTTIPVRLEHNPSYDNFPGENGEVRYGEGVFMGYRGYEHRAIAPRFAFGHGSGYTTFTFGAPVPARDTFGPEETLVVSVPVTNTGARAGAAVVQGYVTPGASRLARPPKELKAFAKVRLEPGETRMVDLVLDDRSFAYWDPGQPDGAEIDARIAALGGFAPAPGERRAAGWQIDAGDHEILVGRSSADITGRCTVRVEAPG
ncbi:MAG: glycoside hydrolase family 3 C-terminal domain-containing protein [Acidimicrobiia bacterium]|jgi:beta-glucosidase